MKRTNQTYCPACGALICIHLRIAQQFARLLHNRGLERLPDSIIARAQMRAAEKGILLQDQLYKMLKKEQQRQQG